MSNHKNKKFTDSRLREGGQDFIGDLKRTIIEAGDAGRAPDLQAWSLSRRIARLEDLAYCFRNDLDQLKIARDNHDERLTNTHKRIVAFQHCIDELPERTEEIDRSVEAANGLIDAYAKRLDALNAKVAYLEKRYKQLDDTCASALDINLDTIRILEKHIELLEHKIEAKEVVG